MRFSRPYLFRDEPGLQEYLGSREAAMAKAIEDEPEERAIQADDEAWAAALAESHAVIVPTLDTVWMDRPREKKVDVSWDHFRRAISDPSTPTYVPGYEVKFHLPFEGNAEVFRRRTSTWSTVLCTGVIGRGELTHTIEYPHDTPSELDAEANGWRQEVEKWLGFASRDIEPFNQSLEARAKLLIAQRRQRIASHRERLAGTSVPIGPPIERDKVSIIEAVVRRPSPARRLEPAKASAHPVELIPASLQIDVFNHILEIIRDRGTAMEKSPATYRKMDEEDRRNVILGDLNSHYRGQASAEAFNRSGKTDILVTFENRNLFVGECKIWRGQKSLTDAVDQLFDYTTWRDTKTALIFFVGGKGFGEICRRAASALATHPQFDHWVRDSAGETEDRAVMRWPDDDERLVDVALTMFHIPDR